MDDLKTRLFLVGKGWKVKEMWRDPETHKLYNMYQADQIARERHRRDWNAPVEARKNAAANGLTEHSDPKLKSQRGRAGRTKPRKTLEQLDRETDI